MSDIPRFPCEQGVVLINNNEINNIGKNSIMIRNESGKECHIFSYTTMPPYNELFVVFPLSHLPFLAMLNITITNP